MWRAAGTLSGLQQEVERGIAGSRRGHRSRVHRAAPSRGAEPRSPARSWSGSSGQRPGQADEAATRFGGRPYHELGALLDAERPRGRLGLPPAGPARRPRAGAAGPRHPPDGREAARGRPRDAGPDRGGHPRDGPRRRRRVPLAGDGHAARGRRGHRRAAGPAADRPLARQPPGPGLVARRAARRRADGRAGDPPRRPVAPAPRRGDGRGGDPGPPRPPRGTRR